MYLFNEQRYQNTEMTLFMAKV